MGDQPARISSSVLEQSVDLSAARLQEPEQRYWLVAALSHQVPSHAVCPAGTRVRLEDRTSCGDQLEVQ
jgi:hypothetical protein